jgi:ATP-dependent Clp protease ATP-binding subunit ClpA
MASTDIVDWDEFDRLMDAHKRGRKPFDDKLLAQKLKEKVIGQNKVADQIANQLKRRLAQSDREKPLGVFMFAGPPGVGKTYFGKVLAQNLYDGKGRLHHVDMTQMADAHAKSALIGSPPGYVGGSGSLTSALQQDPRYVVLLDEFEKAHTEVHKIFLTAWNDGFITDAHTNKRVATTQAIFLLTTNAAVERILEIEGTYKSDPDIRDKSILEALRQAGFAPEVLSRIDYIFVFEPLEERDLARVAKLEIEQLATSYGLALSRIDPLYLLEIVTKGDAFQGGGIRQLSRVLDRELGDQFIEARQNGAASVQISQAADGKAVVRVSS